MKLALSIAAPAVLLALALPAHGDTSALPQFAHVLNTLSAINPSPPLAALTVPSPNISSIDAQTSLSALAGDPTNDTGLRIRAVRTMATFCTGDAPCNTDASPVHTGLAAIIPAYVANPSPSPADLMLMRAAVESLGAANAVLADDLPGLVTLLGNTSRDVRATVVHTLATTCVQSVLDQIVALKKTEPTAQVRGELNLAEQAITSCVNN